MRPIDKATFLLDSLESRDRKEKIIKKVSYFVSETFNLPGYNKIAADRSQINQINEVLHLITRDSAVGVGIFDHKLLTQTVDRVESSINVGDIDYPLGCPKKNRIFERFMGTP